MPRRCLVTAATERVVPWREPEALLAHRRRLVGRASGRVLDLSGSWERNRPFYRPGAVAALAVLTPPASPARPDGADGDAPAGDPEVLGAGVDGLEVPPGSFDTVVSALTLCAASDPAGLLAIAGRGLRPGGTLLVLEHVRAPGLTGLAQRLTSPLGEMTGTGCRLDLDLGRALAAGGFELTDRARFSAPVAWGIPAPFLAGVARRRTVTTAGTPGAAHAHPGAR